MSAERAKALNPRHPIWATALLACAFTLPLTAQETTEAEAPVTAEIQPLAAESLLLDIASTSSGTFVAVGERGHIVLSDDGEIWKQADGVPTRSTFTAVTVHGDDIWAVGHDSVIVSSQDGGASWAQRYYDPDRQQAIMDIHFNDAGHGFAIGAYGLMLVTADDGDSWEDRYPSPDEWHLNALLDLGAGKLLIAAEAGFSYLSEDGGETWEEISMPYLGSMFGAGDAGAGCVLTVGLRGHMQESCDGGRNWQELDSPTESSLSGGVNDGEVTLLVGNSGAVLERRGDSGFSVTYHSAGTDFAAVVALGDGQFLIVGEEGVHRYPESGAGEP